MFNWVVSGEVDPGFGAKKSWRVSVPKNQLVFFGLFIFEILEPSPAILEVSILQKTTFRHDELKLITSWTSLGFLVSNHGWISDLSPGQTESQVDASWKLGSTCDSVWPGLACTCVDLRWLALTLVEIKFAPKSKQVFHRLATQAKSTQVEWRPLAYH